MDPLLIVSPHLDDAVLSCGQLMAGRPDCVVVTVFAGLPSRPRQLTTYDHACGFPDATHARTARVAEDERALGYLQARGVRLDFVDHQYREVGCGTVDTMDVAGELARVLHDTGARMVLGPVGLAHPDHLITAEAFRLLLTMRQDIEPWIYEDMPARVLWPEEVPTRLGWWRDVAGFSVELGFAGTGLLRDKEAALDHYSSQTGSLLTVCGGTLYPALVPERHHRLWRHDP